VTTIGDAAFDAPVTFLQNGAGGQIVLAAGADLTTTNDAITFTAGTGNTGLFSVADDATISSGTGAITVTADSINLGANADRITGTGSLLLQPASANRPIVIGAAGAATDFALDTAELAALTNGFSGITIGQAGGTHA